MPALGCFVTFQVERRRPRVRTPQRGGMAARRSFVVSVMAALAVACADDPGLVIVSGEWAYRLTTLPGDSACVLSEGDVLFGQSGTLLTGAMHHRAGTCLASPNGILASGTSDGGVIEFVVGLCAISGTLVAPDSLAGTATCNGQAGTWHAGRVGLPSDIDFRPGDRYLVRGDSQVVTPVLRDGFGRPMYGRHVTWSTNGAAVATVNGVGVVAAVGVGVARIAAQVGTLRRDIQINVEEPRFTAVSGGAFHTCGLTAAGAAWCWGDGAGGALGDGDAVSGDAPVGVRGAGAYSGISAGSGFTCGVRGGQAHCWGGNAHRQLGTAAAGPVAVPTPVTGPTFVTVAAGGSHACGLTAAGAPWCWGDNRRGTLGDGSRTASAAPVAVSGGLTLASLVATGHTCGLTAAGAAWCWGDNGYGQLGNGATDTAGATTPVAVSGGLAFQRLAAGALFTCGLTTAGALYCWGNNVFGQLGTGGGGASSVPVPASGGRTYVALAAAQDHACAVETGGQLWCWGANQFGQVGDSTLTLRTAPVAVGGSRKFTAVAAGAFHSCAIDDGGVSWCWGYNLHGQLGDGTTAGRLTPTRVLGQP